MARAETLRRCYHRVCTFFLSFDKGLALPSVEEGRSFDSGIFSSGSLCTAEFPARFSFLARPQCSEGLWLNKFFGSSDLLKSR